MFILMINQMDTTTILNRWLLWHSLYVITISMVNFAFAIHSMEFFFEICIQVNATLLFLSSTLKYKKHNYTPALRTPYFLFQAAQSLWERTFSARHNVRSPRCAKPSNCNSNTLTIGWLPLNLSNITESCEIKSNIWVRITNNLTPSCKLIWLYHLTD